MIFLLIAAFIGAILFDAPNLIRQKYWRELAAYSALLLSGFILSLLQTLGVKIPTISKGLAYLLRDILHLSYK